MRICRSIGRYTQKNWDRDQRNKYLAKLDESFHTIAREPYIGHACDYIRDGYRKYHVGRHLILYRQTDVSGEIIRILHERMDVKSHFPEEYED